MGRDYNSNGGVPRGLSRDPDEMNQLLWARKKLKKRRERNDSKKTRKAYFKQKEGGDGDEQLNDK